MDCKSCIFLKSMQLRFNKLFEVSNNPEYISCVILTEHLTPNEARNVKNKYWMYPIISPVIGHIVSVSDWVRRKMWSCIVDEKIP